MQRINASIYAGKMRKNCFIEVKAVLVKIMSLDLVEFEMTLRQKQNSSYQQDLCNSVHVIFINAGKFLDVEIFYDLNHSFLFWREQTTTKLPLLCPILQIVGRKVSNQELESNSWIQALQSLPTITKLEVPANHWTHSDCSHAVRVTLRSSPVCVKQSTRTVSENNHQIMKK